MVETDSVLKNIGSQRDEEVLHQIHSSNCDLFKEIQDSIQQRNQGAHQHNDKLIKEEDK